jgi:hypothetical protein
MHGGSNLVARWYMTPIFFGLLVGIAGAEWLDGGPDYGEAGSWFADGGPDYGEVRSWFGDPIFQASPSQSQPHSFYSSYYPYSGERFFRNPAVPIQIGRWRSGLSGQDWMTRSSFGPIQSDFRNRSLSGIEWPAFEKNWTQTMAIAKNGSSLKIFKGGKWANL